jgi:hypothetical protein
VFAKIVLVIVALGVCACSLLALRQARLQAANELAEARLRVRAIDERVSLVRTAIAGYVTPAQVEEMTRQIESELVPLALQQWGDHAMTPVGPTLENETTLTVDGR